jgi:hypothetical protein
LHKTISCLQPPLLCYWACLLHAVTFSLYLFLCCICRIVQKGTGQEGASLWLLATDSVAPEDVAGWRPTNIAAARQLLGGFSSLRSISKLSARGALLVSSAIPLKVRHLQFNHAIQLRHDVREVYKAANP